MPHRIGFDRGRNGMANKKSLLLCIAGEGKYQRHSSNLLCIFSALNPQRYIINRTELINKFLCQNVPLLGKTPKQRVAFVSKSSCEETRIHDVLDTSILLRNEAVMLCDPNLTVVSISNVKRERNVSCAGGVDTIGEHGRKTI